MAVRLALARVNAVRGQYGAGRLPYQYGCWGMRLYLGEFIEEFIYERVLWLPSEPSEFEVRI